MDKSINPVELSMKALLCWNRDPQAKFLEVKEEKTANGAKMSYVGVRSKPGFFGIIAEKIRAIFGRNKWTLDKVAGILDQVMPDTIKLENDHKHALTALLVKIYEFNLRHKETVPDKVYNKLKILSGNEEAVPEETPLSRPADATIGEQSKELAEASSFAKEPVSVTQPSASPAAEPSALERPTHELNKKLSGRAHPKNRRPFTRGHLQQKAIESAPAVPPQKEASKKPTGGIGFGDLPGLKKAIERRSGAGQE